MVSHRASSAEFGGARLSLACTSSSRLVALLALLALLCTVGVVHAAAHSRLQPARIDASTEWLRAPHDGVTLGQLVVRWSASAADTDGCTLRHTLFATQRDLQQTDQQQADDDGEPVALCTTSELECEVAWPELASKLSLQVLSECLPTLARQAPSWPPVLSAIVSVRRDELLSAVSPNSASLNVDAAALGVGDVRSDLCTFFNQTQGLQWYNSRNWCQPDAHICTWFGVYCSEAMEITALALPSNNLVTVSADGGFSNSVFRSMATLQELDLSHNRQMMLPLQLDLSALTSLLILNLGRVLSVTSAIRLPANSVSLLRVIDVTATTVMPRFSDVPQLEEFYADFTIAFLNFDQIVHLPKLRVLRACEAAVTLAYPHAGDANLTQHIFMNLATTNPVLEVLALGANKLNFNRGNVTDLRGDVPQINSPTLRILNLTASATLHSKWTGPDEMWLSKMPLLQELHLTDMQGLSLGGASAYSPSVASSSQAMRVNTTAFRYASPFLRVIALDRTLVVGDLNDLAGLSHLSHLGMDSSGISSSIQADLLLKWPSLRYLSICCSSLSGPLPAFRGLNELSFLNLENNMLGGMLEPTFLMDSPKIAFLSLESNQFEGLLPLLSNHTHLRNISLANNKFVDVFPGWDLPDLVSLNLAHNTINSSMQPDFWERSPKLRYLDLSQNAISGEIPSANWPRWLERFSLSSNKFVSGGGTALPKNITAYIYDVSYNQLSGPVFLTDLKGHLPMWSLNLGANHNLTCPLNLAGLTDLLRLDLPSAGFDGCNFNSIAEVNIPSTYLQYLDISSNNWKPMLISLEQPRLNVFKASEANIHGFHLLARGIPLHTVDVSRNPFGSGTLAPIGNPFAFLFSQCPQLQFFYASSCGIEMNVMDLIGSLNAQGSRDDLYELMLADNNLYGTLSPSLFLHNSDLYSLPTSLRMFVLAGNKAVTGNLPEAASGYSDSEYTDLSGTGLSGPIPESWGAFLNLQRLSLHDTDLRCTMKQDPVTGQWGCDLPDWVGISNLTSAMSGETAAVGYTCPGLTLPERYSILSVNDQYYYKTLCTCNDKNFGKNGQCRRCPAGCTCSGAVVQDCYPIISYATQRGTVLPLVSVSNVILCPLTVTGRSLCNPAGLAWPTFNSSYVVTGNSDWSALNLTGWCFEGHTSRLCSKCADGFFTSGRWCLQCMSTGAHVVIVIANVTLFLLLVFYLYVRSPGWKSSVLALSDYHRSVDHTTNLGVLNEGSQRARTISEQSFAFAENSLGAPPTPVHHHHHRPSREPPSPSSSSGDTVASVTMDMSTTTNLFELKATSYSNPLRLLVFHGQQLSILLLTATSLPSVLAGFISVISSGSGFSLSSILALECINKVWDIEQQTWAALVAPAAVLIFASCIYLRERWRARGGRQILDSTASRWYGVCVSLLYVFVFPCAQTALAALACTDFREFHPSTEGASSRIYLNLYPWVQCDHHWRHTLLAPGILGVIVWFVLFPIFSTLLFRSLRRRLKQHSDASVWPLCADLLKPYHSRYWYWEQILLVRRLLLVILVTLVPSSSLYLPLTLFALIQLSALAQHLASPYRSSWLNRGELCSLYLLLLNYITALVLHEELAGSGRAASQDQASLDGWTITLFFANVVFIILLILLLFKSLQQGWSNLVTRIAARCCGREQARSRRSKKRAQKHAAHTTKIKMRRGPSPLDDVAVVQSDDCGATTPMQVLTPTNLHEPLLQDDEKQHSDFSRAQL